MKDIDKMRILGVLLIIFALFGIGKGVIDNAKIMELTPTKCAGLAEGTVVDYKLGTKWQYAGSKDGYNYDVYYDVIEYEVNNQKYQITSRHASVGDPVIGATTTVHYNPKDPSKAYDNSAPTTSGREYYYPIMVLIMGLVLALRLDKIFGNKN